MYTTLYMLADSCQYPRRHHFFAGFLLAAAAQAGPVCVKYQELKRIDETKSMERCRKVEESFGLQWEMGSAGFEPATNRL